MSKRLFVANLPYSLKKEEFMDLFGPYGEITFINLIMNVNGGNKGFGFVEFQEDNDAFNAIKDLNNSNLQGKKIKVIEANHKR